MKRFIQSNMVTIVIAAVAVLVWLVISLVKKNIVNLPKIK
jgi:hypothetical protein